MKFLKVSLTFVCASVMHMFFGFYSEGEVKCAFI